MNKFNSANVFKAVPINRLSVVEIPLDGRIYRINISMSLMCEIEKEMGGFSTLIACFQNEQWRVSDIVTLVQIMLSSIGSEIDYMVLGNEILSQGILKYCELIGGFIETVTLGKQKS